MQEMVKMTEWGVKRKTFFTHRYGGVRVSEKGLSGLVSISPPKSSVESTHNARIFILQSALTVFLRKFKFLIYIFFNLIVDILSILE